MTSNTIVRHMDISPEVFDPTNPEHINAFKMLVLDQPNKQHPRLRFNLEFPFVNVPQMMLHKIANAYINLTNVPRS